MRGSRLRDCPACRSSVVRRSRRRGLFERIVLPLLLRRPYRCLDCDRRHYGSVFARAS